MGGQQPAPIFDEESTAEEVLAGIDLTGKRVIVTGVSAGLGVETARVLVAKGAEVIGLARNLAKAREACEALLPKGATATGAQITGPGTLRLEQCDLASLASVRDCAARLREEGAPIHVLIANAGVMACPQGRTQDGFETQFGTNHLGHFVLINHLTGLMPKGARVVIVASAGHRNGNVDLDDPGFERTPYDPFVAYGRSKTANILFAVELNRRLKARGIRAASVHPGGIRTQLLRHLSPETLAAYAERTTKGLAPVRMKTIPQGAATAIWAGFRAAADDIGGKYCEDCAISFVAEQDITHRKGVRPYAIDPARAQALWALSERMVGESFSAAS